LCLHRAASSLTARSPFIHAAFDLLGTHIFTGGGGRAEEITPRPIFFSPFDLFDGQLDPGLVFGCV
jgi:hypothetical protein